MKQSAPIALCDAFEKFIAETASGKRKMPSGICISAGVVKNYTCCLHLLKAFEQKEGITLRILPLPKMTALLIRSEQRYWKRFFYSFSHFLYNEKKHFDNFVSTNFKTIKTFFNYLQVEKALPVGNFHRLFRVPHQQPLPLVLMPEQLQFLITDKNFEQQLPLHLQRTKDIFVFGCSTGLRISDLMQLQRKHLVKKTTGTYLNIYTQKTITPVLIPLPEYCLAILAKYQRASKKYLLPHLSNTNLNLQVKEIGKLAQWTEPVPKYRSRQGKMVEIKNKQVGCWKFYQHLCSHTMRRTAITSLLMLGVSEDVVRKLSGHAPGSKEFYRYVSLAQSYIDQQVRAAHEKLVLNNK